MTLRILRHTLSTGNWNISFLRAVENQLDGFHLPFVHYNTIGRGNRTLINGVALKQIDDVTFVWHAAAERDVGQKPKVRLNVDPQKAGTYIEFIYPNLWQKHISENMRVLAFFAVSQ
jgi:phenylpropionate dioxygenase-like ring-hydroxylating dioxygenase large terminal subunit